MIGNKYILAALLACAPLVSQAAETTFTFDIVTEIEHRQSDIRVTGVLVNGTTPTTVILPWSNSGTQYDRCERMFNVVMSLPGVYSVTVVTDTRTVPESPTPVPFFVRCSSALKP